MKLLVLVLIGLVGGYYYFLNHTTDIVISQTQQISGMYQKADAISQNIAKNE